jgi:hypothetical protein
MGQEVRHTAQEISNEELNTSDILEKFIIVAQIRGPSIDVLAVT